MELPINKDPQELNKNMLGGRKWWQYLCIVLAFVVAVVFTLVFKDSMGNSFNSIICAVIVVPLGYVGVFSKNGLDFFEYYKKKKANNTGNNIFVYVSEPIKKKDVSDRINQVRGRKRQKGR
jgi:undecaprenyl pyrophosphate phosphatase UppP